MQSNPVLEASSLLGIAAGVGPDAARILRGRARLPRAPRLRGFGPEPPLRDPLKALFGTCRGLQATR